MPNKVTKIIADDPVGDREFLKFSFIKSLLTNKNRNIFHSYPTFFDIKPDIKPEPAKDFTFWDRLSIGAVPILKHSIISKTTIA